jgi:protoporphyrinogen oxidase
MEKDLSPQVIIIGAGLSGLSAADYILSQNPNVKITILEAMDRIGGRTITQEIKGVKFDMGA